MTEAGRRPAAGYMTGIALESRAYMSWYWHDGLCVTANSMTRCAVIYSAGIVNPGAA